VSADHPASLASFSCGFRHLLGLDLAKAYFTLRYPDVIDERKLRCTRPSGTTPHPSVS